ncbi:MAG: phage head-tail connector protein [Nitrosomonas sp.]|uniref:head-tail connector protein n=1 Tax=Nitrosomonas sp. TaxID=42353 RepID=UPI0025CE9439|nr:phage head-tail connector protein [Nitrosomonas sp.]MBY0474213.1 phage head-tail connector protein [Nitrosomonas sp.]
MPEKIITAPTSEPVTLAEAKAQLRVTNSYEDALIASLIVAARDLCEAETGRALMPQTWELSLNCFSDEMCLQHVPVASITSIKYTDADGAEQTLASTEYVLDTSSNWKSRVVLAVGKSWPQIYSGINNVRIRYVAGYPNASAVPQSLKQWMLLQISHWFRNRESVSMNGAGAKLEFVDNLLNAYRIYNL